MRIEVIPVIIGALLAIAGLLLAADAIIPDGAFVAQERRRRQRTERNRPGELAIAIGMFAMAAALIGRDTWAYSTIVAIIGVIALAVGSFLNLNFLRDYLFNRGVSRRGAPPSAQSARSSGPAPAVMSRGPASNAQKQPGPADRSPDQPVGKPRMRDNRKHPRG